MYTINQDAFFRANNKPISCCRISLLKIIGKQSKRAFLFSLALFSVAPQLQAQSIDSFNLTQATVAVGNSADRNRISRPLDSGGKWLARDLTSTVVSGCGSLVNARAGLASGVANALSFEVNQARALGTVEWLLPKTSFSKYTRGFFSVDIKSKSAKPGRLELVQLSLGFKNSAQRVSVRKNIALGTRSRTVVFDIAKDFAGTALPASDGAQSLELKIENAFSCGVSLVVQNPILKSSQTPITKVLSYYQSNLNTESPRAERLNQISSQSAVGSSQNNNNGGLNAAASQSPVKMTCASQEMQRALAECQAEAQRISTTCLTMTCTCVESEGTANVLRGYDSHYGASCVMNDDDLCPNYPGYCVGDPTKCVPSHLFNWTAPDLSSLDSSCLISTEDTTLPPGIRGAICSGGNPDDFMYEPVNTACVTSSSGVAGYCDGKGHCITNDSVDDCSGQPNCTKCGVNGLEACWEGDCLGGSDFEEINCRGWVAPPCHKLIKVNTCQPGGVSCGYMPDPDQEGKACSLNGAVGICKNASCVVTPKTPTPSPSPKKSPSPTKP